MEGNHIVIGGRYNALTDGRDVTGFAHTTTSSCTSWIIDSRTTDHMTELFTMFQSLSPMPKQNNIRVGNGSLVPIAGQGTIQDLSTGNVISHGLESHGLYTFEGSRVSVYQSIRKPIAALATPIEEIELWYVRC